ncbi:unnamed protein product, partial [Prorocentrum cordatum]
LCYPPPPRPARESPARALATVPGDLSWGAVPAEESARVAKQQCGRLLLTDVDRLSGAVAAPRGGGACSRGEGEAAAACGPGDPGSVIFSCTLPAAAYLTMAFREATRQDVSWRWQAAETPGRKGHVG